MATVDFTLEDIRKVVREEVREEFQAAFRPAFDVAFKESFRSALDTAFKEAFRPAFDTAFKESFRPAFDDAVEPIAGSIQADIQRLNIRIEEGFAEVNQRLRRFGQAAHELLVSGDERRN